MRIAIACSGLDRIRRGFETFAKDLFDNLQSVTDVDVTLFKGSGKAAPNEVPLRNLHRNSPLWRGFSPWIDPYMGEQITFSLSLARRLKRGRFDILHISDGQLGASLLHLFPDRSKKFRIVFSNGGPLFPSDYEQFDLIQQVSPTELEDALSYGLDGSRMILLPYGVSVSKFKSENVVEMRRKLGIPPAALVVLTVGAHGAHKRTEFVIRQLATRDSRTYLVISGEEDRYVTPRLKALANSLLGDRVSFVSVPHKAMHSLYAVANLYVHASLREGLPLAVLEAMAAGLPVIHHDEPGMNWLVGDGGLALDMTQRGELANAVEIALTDAAMIAKLGQKARERAEGRFSWEVLLPRYLEMYEDVLSLPSTH